MFSYTWKEGGSSVRDNGFSRDEERICLSAEVTEKIILSRKVGADFVITQNFLKRRKEWELVKNWYPKIMLRKIWNTQRVRKCFGPKNKTKQTKNTPMTFSLSICTLTSLRWNVQKYKNTNVTLMLLEITKSKATVPHLFPAAISHFVLGLWPKMSCGGYYIQFISAFPPSAGIKFLIL